ncbi:metallophosphoesterase [Longimycelium tulufanense]|uniref:Metallophosphoesterase n=1 Tax=Longimycelium tulufanense TaxID=907463 RepID=A0A8J3CH19_9PSEU|nr:metallophosphoesterase [Longimycelium tulufanense]GGM65735.1 metallophosphoesterase [Longimycelium tulufanense]
MALGAGTVAYAAGYERRRWTLRTATLPVLAPEARPMRVLHISDLHMTPGQESKQRWVAGLAELAPDLVVNTGDNLAHPRAVPAVLRALGPLLDVPGVFVWGSNDYYAPRFKNPARYLLPAAKTRRVHGTELPWQDLRAAMTERGWLDLTHVRRRLTVAGQTVIAAGVDDPHLRRDRYDQIAGQPDPTAALRLGVTHSPEPRVLDAFASDGYDLVMAGHTHGGQLRLPGYGAIVTNCDLDRSRARGASRWGARTWLHVSAGLGTSPFAPVRFACPPEASLLTLVPRKGNAGQDGVTESTGARFGASADAL